MKNIYFDLENAVLENRSLCENDPENLINTKNEAALNVLKVLDGNITKFKFIVWSILDHNE